MGWGHPHSGWLFPPQTQLDSRLLGDDSRSGQVDVHINHHTGLFVTSSPSHEALSPPWALSG